MTHVAAVDFGATSVRVCRVDLDAPGEPEVVHRVRHHPVRDEDGHLRWDWPYLVEQMEIGLARCLAAGPLASIGIDTWAVDYGLLDDDGRLLSAPYCYRDHRTDGYLAIVDTVGARRLYGINGLQTLPFNSIFQLAVHDRGELTRAAAVVWLPELLAHHLTGTASTEATSAGSSGLVDISTGDWSGELCAAIDLDPSLLLPIDRAGRNLGTWNDTPVHLVGGHDTASAVAGMGPVSAGGSAFIASGTWLLVGIERGGPDTSRPQFTNETGALGGFRYLRNVTGFWLVEQCRPRWNDRSVPELVALAEPHLVDAVAGRKTPAEVDVTDDVFLAPEDMLDVYCAAAGLAPDAEPGVVVASMLWSMARAIADVVTDLPPHDDVILFGGAARIDVFRRLVARAVGRPVRTGPAEAAAVGNALVQGVALGHFDDLASARRRV